MLKLICKKNKYILSQNMKQTKTLRDKMQGLIGKKPLKPLEALWLQACPSVHTFFMTFKIDVIFTNRDFKVIALFEQVPARRILWGGFKAYHAFELFESSILKAQVQKGDDLYVEY